MRILHIISSSGFFGAENVVLNIMGSIKNKGANPYLICLKNSGKPEPQIHLEARKQDIFTNVLSCRSRMDFRSIFRLRDFIREKDVQIIHTHGYKSNMYGLLASKISRVPIVATLHGWTGGGKKNIFYEKLDRRIVKGMDHLISVSPSITDWLKKLHINSEKISYIPNAVDTNKFSADNASDVRSELNIEGKIVIGVAGRLTAEKGHCYLIRAFKDVHSEIRGIKLLIVGSGDLREKLQQEAERSGVSEDVIFTGARKDMASIYKSMDMFVLSSITEGLPMVLLEAMSMGLPVVASRVGGIPHVISGENGIMVSPADPTELKEGIIRLLRDDKLRKTMGEKARSAVLERFSLDIFSQSYVNAYEYIVGKNGKN